MSHISAKRSIKTSFLVDIIDIGINLTMMIMTGSVVLLAEALAGCSDLLATSLLLVGLKSSRRRKNKEHPFGFGKELFTWSLISAIGMMVVGAGLAFYFGLDRFIHPHEIKHIGLAYAALLFAIGTNSYSLSVSTRRLLGKSPLRSLFRTFIQSTHVETKNTFILDLCGTSAAMIGMISLLIYQFTGLKHFDGAGSMMMALLMALASGLLIYGVKDFLTGKRASPQIEKEIEQKALEIDEVLEVIGMDTMHVGTDKIIVNLDVLLDKNLSMTQMEKIISTLKAHVLKEVPTIQSIHVASRVHR
jgi:cation diffusion facilitator family transporter